MTKLLQHLVARWPKFMKKDVPISTLWKQMKHISHCWKFSTIQQHVEYLQSLAATVNMPYVNITLDVGAALNAFKFPWNGVE